jgi:hypothetical protein
LMFTRGWKRIHIPALSVRSWTSAKTLVRCSLPRGETTRWGSARNSRCVLTARLGRPRRLPSRLCTRRCDTREGTATATAVRRSTLKRRWKRRIGDSRRDSMPVVTSHHVDQPVNWRRRKNEIRKHNIWRTKVTKLTCNYTTNR